MNWILQKWWRRKLRKQLSSAFKMKNECEAISASCVLKITHVVEPLYLSLKRLVLELGIKKIQNNRSRLERSELEKPAVRPNPLFTQGEISSIVRRFWIGMMVLALFLISEGALYQLTASLFIPGGNWILKLSVAIFLATLTLFCIDYGLKQHYKYCKLRSIQDKMNGNSLELRLQNDKRIIGYVLIVIALIAILLAGMARISFLENVDTSGLPSERKRSVLEASKWASWLTLIGTLGSSLLLGVIKRDQSKIIQLYQTYKYWNKALKRRNAYYKSLIRESNKLHFKTEQIVHVGTQLIIDLKRVFKMEQEYDAKYDQLNQEYVDAKNRPGFSLNEHMFRKYSPIQGAHLELFRFGVFNSAEVKERLSFATEVQKLAADYLQEHGTAIYRQDEFSELPKPSTNSIHNKQMIFHPFNKHA